MRKILTSFVALCLSAAAGFAAPYDGDYNTARAGVVGQAAVYRAPTLPIPSVPTTPAPAAPTVPGQPVVPPVVSYGIESCMGDLGACVESSLPNGIAGLYNADMRNSVINGMNLCGQQIDKCVNDATRIDGKKAYYAKNDVWVDFNSRVVQPQYYSMVLMKTGLTPNQAENTCWLLDKNVQDSSFKQIVGGDRSGQMGSVVNNRDWQRNSYARWDATTGECLVRVAAYNKDELITNKWLGLGDDKPAEQWLRAGSSFSCKKETFDFNLMNQTKSAALIGVAGGTAVGAGVGAIVGAATTVAKDRLEELNPAFCDEGDYRRLLDKSAKELRFSTRDIDTERQCRDFLEQYVKDPNAAATISLSYGDNGMLNTTTAQTQTVILAEAITFTEGTEFPSGMIFPQGTTRTGEVNLNALPGNETGLASGQTITIPAGAELPVNAVLPANTVITIKNTDKLTKEGKILLAKMEEENGIGAGFGALAGAGIGAGAGGIATAITAFVESNNILCRIGNNLGSVAFGKSGRIKNLKDYYVEWALNLPDTVLPQQTVTECNSWNTACSSISNINDCIMAAVNYKPADSQTSIQVGSACTVSGSTCVANNPVAVSHGACQ